MITTFRAHAYFRSIFLDITEWSGKVGDNLQSFQDKVNISFRQFLYWDNFTIILYSGGKVETNELGELLNEVWLYSSRRL